MPSECSLPQDKPQEIKAGIPNLKYSTWYCGIPSWWSKYGDAHDVRIREFDGPLYSGWAGAVNARVDFDAPGGWGLDVWAKFDASYVSDVYRDDFQTVQPSSMTVNYYIRAK